VHNKAIGFGQQTDPKWHGDDSCWSEFAILLAAALLGGLAIIPYGVSLLTSNQRKPLKFPPPDALAAVIFFRPPFFLRSPLESGSRPPMRSA
jgi:hypothetical protein